MIQKAVEHLKSVDPVLERLMQKIGPMTGKARRVAVFQSLVQAIVYQQLNGKAAATILSRFKALFGDGQFPTAEQVLAMQPEFWREMETVSDCRRKVSVEGGGFAVIIGTQLTSASSRYPGPASAGGTRQGRVRRRLTKASSRFSSSASISPRNGP